MSACSSMHVICILSSQGHKPAQDFQGSRIVLAGQVLSVSHQVQLCVNGWSLLLHSDLCVHMCLN